MTRILFILAILCGSLILTTCDKMEEVEPQLLYRTNGFSEIISQGYWVFATDQDGKVIASRQIKAPGEPLTELYGVVHGTFSITTFAYSNFGTPESPYNQYNLSTTQGLTQGFEQIYSTGPFPQTPFPDVKGNASLKLSNYSDATDPYFSVFFEDGLSSWNTLLDYDSSVYSGSTFTSNLNLRETPTDILAITYFNNVPVHQWLNGVKVGDEVTADFGNFVPSKTITLNKTPKGGASVRGVKGGHTYFLSWSDHWERSKSSNKNEVLKLGYVEGFDKYITAVTLNPILCCVSGENVSYFAQGAIRPSVTLPDYSFSLENNTLSGCSYKFSNEYTYKNFYFELRSPAQSPTLFIGWSFLMDDKHELVVPHIPKEILDQNPLFSVQNLNLNGVNFTKELDGFTFEEHVKQIGQRDTFESLTYSFQYSK